MNKLAFLEGYMRKEAASFFKALKKAETFDDGVAAFGSELARINRLKDAEAAGVAHKLDMEQPTLFEWGEEAIDDAKALAKKEKADKALAHAYRNGALHTNLPRK